MNIQQTVLNDLNKILDGKNIEDILNNICFGYGDGQYEPGNYVYEENGLYYYVGVGDRGGIEKKIESKNVDDVLYEIYKGITFSEAMKYSMIHRENGKDFRRILFARQLEILRKLMFRDYRKKFHFRYTKGEIKNNCSEECTLEKGAFFLD